MSQIKLYQQAAAPVAPSAGVISLYALNDNTLKWKDSAGVEHNIGTGNGTLTGTGGENVEFNDILFTGSLLGVIDADTLLSGTWATPGAIGSGTPNTGIFTTGTFTNTINANNVGDNIRIKADGTNGLDGSLSASSLGVLRLGHWAGNGLRINANDTIDALVGGASRLFIDSSGFNGVLGATTPAAVSATSLNVTQPSVSTRAGLFTGDPGYIALADDEDTTNRGYVGAWSGSTGTLVELSVGRVLNQSGAFVDDSTTYDRWTQRFDSRLASSSVVWLQTPAGSSSAAVSNTVATLDLSGFNAPLGQTTPAAVSGTTGRFDTLGVGEPAARTFSVSSASSIPMRITSSGTDTQLEILDSSGSANKSFIQGSSGNLLLGAQGASQASITSTGLQAALGSTTRNTAAVSYLGVGGAHISEKGIHIQNTDLTGVAQEGIRSTITASSAATTAIRSFVSTPVSAAATYTTSAMEHFRVADLAKGTGHTVTTQSGFTCDNLTAGASNYGFRGQVGSGTDKWNLYMDGTADNYLAGSLLIGTAGAALANRALAVNVSKSVLIDFTQLSTNATDNVIQIWHQATGGDNQFQRFYTEGGGGSLRGSIDFNRAATQVRYNVTSDMNIKQLLGPMPEVGHLIDQVQLHNYMVKETNYITNGPFAQELYPFFPDVVRPGNSEAGELWQVNPQGMIWPMLKEIQSLRKRVAQLETYH